MYRGSAGENGDRAVEHEAVVVVDRAGAREHDVAFAVHADDVCMEMRPHLARRLDRSVRDNQIRRLRLLRDVHTAEHDACTIIDVHVCIVRQTVLHLAAVKRENRVRSVHQHRPRLRGGETIELRIDVQVCAILDLDLALEVGRILRDVHVVVTILRGEHELRRDVADQRRG